MKKLIIIVLALVGVGAGLGAYYIRKGGPEPQVTTALISRGDVIDTVGATGTLEAVTIVQVGTQVSGTVKDLYADFNSIVHKGQVIARLDPSLIDTQIEQQRANVIRSEADLERLKVALSDAQQKLKRAQDLAARNLIPTTELETADVNARSADAQLKSAQASLTQAKAALNNQQVNLEHTVITAPIDGIVISRNVDVGQTVAASMQAPTLFVIAADLTKMQVNANIDEADVGRMRPGQNVRFRVDAYPTETFEGTVSQIRLQPVVVQNVTTYGTVIDVPNTQLKLKPGMTANVKIEIAKRSDALRIPNAALRFRPTTDLFAALNQPVPPEMQGGGRGGRGGFGNRAAGAPTSAQQSSPVAAPQGSTGAQEAPRADAGGRRGFDPARMMERFKSMSPDEQKQFIARMKERGQDTSAFEKQAAQNSQSSNGPQSSASALRQKYGAPANAQTAQTIDALFPPLPPVESRGRAWLFMDHQLKPVNLRLGVTDGTNTELISTELQPGMEVVTGVTGLGSTRTTGGQQGTGNPLMPQRGGPGGFRGGR
jgi:HlyD family secretion protein